jgi:hypothetical protein
LPFDQACCHACKQRTRAGGPELQIDVPVKLDKANVMFDIGHLVLDGDMHFVLGDMDLLATGLSD